MLQIQDQDDKEALVHEMETVSDDESESEDTELSDGVSEAGDEAQDIPDIQAETNEQSAESEISGEDAGAKTVGAKSADGKTQSAAVGKLAAQRSLSARAGEPYDWEHCTIVVTLQIMPPRAGQDAAARKVFLSARTHADPPQSASMRWSELEPRLPEELKSLLAHLRQELPERAAQRTAAAQAEREREQELKASAAKRTAEKQAQGKSAARTAKRTTKVDLNAPPVLTGSPDGMETVSTATANRSAATTNAPGETAQPATNAKPEAAVAQAQMSLF